MLTNSPSHLLIATLAFVLVLSAAAGTHAQAPAAQSPAGTIAAQPSGSASPTAVSLARIRRLLREAPPTTPSAKSPLAKLEYYVQVVGESPRIDFFKDFNIGRVSSVQYGGMTHAEFLKVTAPFWRKW